ncbi:MAG: hypothetical protein M3M88_05310 [Thermoproteota archaeon]|nr:hypothetical protein [Thermoproteota archaeon]
MVDRSSYGIVFSNCGGGVGVGQTEIPCKGHEKPDSYKNCKKWIYALIEALQENMR